jgi:hypothetical protein
MSVHRVIGNETGMEDIVGKQYVVFDSREHAPLDAEIVYVTEDPQDAVTWAQEHGGVVYAYDVTAHEDFINETLVYDGTHRSMTS